VLEQGSFALGGCLLPFFFTTVDWGFSISTKGKTILSVYIASLMSQSTLLGFPARILSLLMQDPLV
jgi:hypothetical protein